MEVSELLDLASERLGGRVIAANDEFFAPKENLIKAAAPVFRAGEYTDRGKWMDGWETRRRREPGHDWCVIRLGVSGRVHAVLVDTSFFTGNYPPECSIEAATLGGYPDAASLGDPAVRWHEILPRSPLRGDLQNWFRIPDRGCWTHLRFKIFPDGGVARLRVHGEVVPDRERLAAAGDVDLAAAEHGGLVLAASDMFFGSRHNLILPGLPSGMHDGWETRRRRGPGHDWVIVRLGVPGTIHRVEVDTSFFKGNAPGKCSLELTTIETLDADPLGPAARCWSEVLSSTPLQPDTRHQFEIAPFAGARFARLNIFPDGGVARLRLFGRVTA
jgi:allantoicase